MPPSKKQLQKIGRRIRHGEAKPEDLEAIESYRNGKIPELLETLNVVNRLLSSNHIPKLISGRPKRLKSIIRKLERAGGTSLSRMIDIVGMRIIVSNMAEQDQVSVLICDNLAVIKQIDYRDSELYRAVHLYVDRNECAIEIQIRTLPQQLWAIESESFGEQVKEGIYDKNEESYLSELAEQCEALDTDTDKAPQPSATLYGINRGPVTGIYPKLYENFYRSMKITENFGSYIIVFDRKTNELLSYDFFPLDEEAPAVREFSRLTLNLAEDRFDVLLLNATDLACLKVTHSNYFPIA